MGTGKERIDQRDGRAGRGEGDKQVPSSGWDRRGDGKGQPDGLQARHKVKFVAEPRAVMLCDAEEIAGAVGGVQQAEHVTRVAMEQLDLAEVERRPMVGELV